MTLTVLEPVNLQRIAQILSALGHESFPVVDATTGETSTTTRRWYDNQYRWDVSLDPQDGQLAVEMTTGYIDPGDMRIKKLWGFAAALNGSEGTIMTLLDQDSKEFHLRTCSWLACGATDEQLKDILDSAIEGIQRFFDEKRSFVEKELDPNCRSTDPGQLPFEPDYESTGGSEGEIKPLDLDRVVDSIERVSGMTADISDYDRKNFDRGWLCMEWASTADSGMSMGVLIDPKRRSIVTVKNLFDTLFADNTCNFLSFISMDCTKEYGTSIGTALSPVESTMRKMVLEALSGAHYPECGLTDAQLDCIVGKVVEKVHNAASKYWETSYYTSFDIQLAMIR